MHRAERVLKAAVLRGGIDPARRLELGNAAQALHPCGVDDVLLGGFARDPAGPCVGDVLVDRIRDEAATRVRVGSALHEGLPQPLNVLAYSASADDRPT